MLVLIAGAGIGGLTAALALRQAGFDVHVYEQASVLREVGAGLGLGSNAVRILHRLGLADEMRSLGVASLSIDFRNWQTAAVVARVPLGDAATVRWGAPYYHVHRADLRTALRSALGEQHITLGARCVSVEQSGSDVTIGFADGRHATGDLLIGADGIHSLVREYIAGPGQPTLWPQLAWRGLTPASVAHEVGLEMRQHVYPAPGKIFVTYYVSAGRLVNWVGHTPSDGWREESWAARGDRDDALAQYEDWHPQVRALIAGTESVFKWAMYDRPPLETWTKGRVALLGDAAHPMLPFMGQGAAQSIEDAYVLARSLALDGDAPQRALASYSDRRRERATLLQAASRESGRNLQLSDPAQIAAQQARMRENAEARNDWVWGYDVERDVPGSPV